jgi:transposase
LKPLPSCRPDFNPIKPIFTKLKAGLRKAAQQTVGTLGNIFAELLNQFTPAECKNYLRGAGYSVQTK